MVSRRHAGAAAAVLLDRAIVHQKGYGLARLKSKTAISGNNSFLLASLTKPFSALAIMMLQDKKLQNSDSLNSSGELAPELDHVGRVLR